MTLFFLVMLPCLLLFDKKLQEFTKKLHDGDISLAPGLTSPFFPFTKKKTL